MSWPTNSQLETVSFIDCSFFLVTICVMNCLNSCWCFQAKMMSKKKENWHTSTGVFLNFTGPTILSPTVPTALGIPFSSLLHVIC